MSATSFFLPSPENFGLRLLVLLIALALDAMLGEMPWLFGRLPHPVVVIGRAIAFFDRRLNRIERSPAQRRLRGVITLATLGLASLAAGALLSAVFGHFGGWGLLAEGFTAAIFIAQRSLYDHVARVAEALETGGLAAGRAAVGHIVGRAPDSLDSHGVARAAIESLAENFSDGIVAPVCFYLLAGLPGLLLYKTVNTLDSMIGHLTPRHRDFGWASARFDDLLNLIPARLSGLLITLAAVCTRRDGRGALRIMQRDARRHRSPNAGWPEAAMAGALGLALAGPRRYGTVLVEDHWMGDGRARAEAADIRAALAVYRAACVIEAAAAALALAVTTS